MKEVYVPDPDYDRIYQKLFGGEEKVLEPEFDKYEEDIWEQI